MPDHVQVKGSSTLRAERAELTHLAHSIRQFIQDEFGLTAHPDPHDHPVQQLQDSIAALLSVVRHERLQQKKVAHGLRRREALFHAAVEQTADSFFLLNRDGKLLYSSDRALELLDYTRKEAGSLYLWDIAPNVEPGWFQRLWKRVAASGETLDRDGLHRRKDGSTFDVRVRACVRAHGDEQIMLAQAWDITDRVTTRRQLERLVAIVEATPDLVGLADSHGRIQFLNKGGRRLVGLAADGDVSETTISDYHPAWATERILQEGIPTAIERGSWVGETALFTADGREIPTSQVILSHRDQRGQLESVSTLARDISALKASDERHLALIRALPDLLFRISTDGTFLDVNAVDSSVLLLPPEQIVGMHISESSLPPEVIRRALELLNLAAATGQPQEFEYELERKSEPQHFECRIVRSGADECLCIVRDVTARVRAEAILTENLQKLHSLAQLDPLTGLLNAEATRKQLKWALAGLRRTDRQGALLFLDLDGFKPVNDLFGHEMGDEVLKEVALRMKRSVRATDLAGRIGGDEFAIILKNVDDDEIRAIVRKLLRTIAKPYGLGDDTICLSVSIGIARFGPHGASAADVMKKADAAMYEVKHRGGSSFAFADQV